MLADYKLRYSKRAKYLQLRLTYQGLEVIVPAAKKITVHAIEHFIQQKQSWIKRNWQRFSQYQTETEALPDTVHLQAVNEIWEIKYFQTDQAKLTLQTNLSRQVTLLGNISNKKLCFKKLKTWLIEIATLHLHNELEKLSEETGMVYDKLSIRNNATRWGSCSNKRNISLCCKLIFLPAILMRHVIIHELCHTKFMHHGKAFWNLFEKFDPAAREHTKQLRIAAASIPFWAQ